MSACDPNDIYNDSVVEKDIPFLTYCNDALTIFIVANSPFLIILPFCVEKLRTNSRQIIAMIVLSDLINTVNYYIYLQFEKSFENNDLGGLCLITNIMQDCSFQWSQIWSVFLLVNVLFTLKPWLGLKGGNKSFLIFAHSFTWIYGIVVTVFISEALFFFPIAFNDNYIARKGCQGNFTFMLENGECIYSEESRKFVYAYYSCMSLFLLIGVLVYAKTLHLSSKLWKESRKTLQMNEPCVSNEDLDDGHAFAVNHTRCIFMTTLRLSTTAFIYVISDVPIIVTQLYMLKHGPIRNDVLQTILYYWFEYNGILISTANVISYGYLSPIYRRELTRLTKRVLFSLKIFLGKGDFRRTNVRVDLDSGSFDSSDFSISGIGHDNGGFNSSIDHTLQ